MGVISLCVEYSRLKEGLRLHLEEFPGDNIGRYVFQGQLELLYRELLFLGIIKF